MVQETDESAGKLPSTKPSVIGRPVSGDEFRPRPEMELVLKAIKNGESLWLSGPRRAGKTSILHELARLFPNESGFLGIGPLQFEEFDSQHLDRLASKVDKKALRLILLIDEAEPNTVAKLPPDLQEQMELRLQAKGISTILPGKISFVLSSSTPLVSILEANPTLSWLPKRQIDILPMNFTA